MVRTSKEASEKWAERIRASGKWMKAGVEHPREDWAEKAKAAKAKRDAGLSLAMAEDRINKGIDAAGTAKWSKRTKEVGVARWTADAPKAEVEYGGAMGDVLSAIDEAKAVIAGLPDTTVAERAEKSKAYQIAMSEAMKKRRGY